MCEDFDVHTRSMSRRQRIFSPSSSSFQLLYSELRLNLYIFFIGLFYFFICNIKMASDHVFNFIIHC